MKKNNLRIHVQNAGERGFEFARRLEEICKDISETNNLEVPPTVTFTTDSNGRQTANIQYITESNDKSKQSLFNGEYLREAYARFINISNNLTIDELFDFLLKENLEDYK